MKMHLVMGMIQDTIYLRAFEDIAKAEQFLYDKQDLEKDNKYPIDWGMVSLDTEKETVAEMIGVNLISKK